MKLTLISLRSDYLEAYDPIQQSNLSEDNIKEQYTRSVLADPEGAYKARVHEKSLFVLGYFDDRTGIIEPLAAPKKLMDMSSCFPRGFLSKKENA